MRRKKAIPFTQKFPNADPLALSLLERMLAFEPKDRPSAEEVRFTEDSFYDCHASHEMPAPLTNVLYTLPGSCLSLFQEYSQCG
jgi:hypothetical protein